LTPPICDTGWPAPGFDLEGVDGRRHTLAEIRGPKATLVMFLCNHCPYVQAVLDDIIRDVTELKPLGLGAVAIMANDTEAYRADSFANMKRLAAEKSLPFPYLIDPTQQVARAYGAICTPDIFGFDADLGLAYRGRVRALAGLAPVAGAPREMFEAMKRIAATGQGPADQVASLGCSIKWRAA